MISLSWEGKPAFFIFSHGLSANAGEWTRFSKIEYYAKKYNFIIIMPEVQRSFYCSAAYGPDYFRLWQTNCSGDLRAVVQPAD